MRSLSLVAVFVMGTPVALALVRLLNHPVTNEATGVPPSNAV